MTTDVSPRARAALWLSRHLGGAIGALAVRLPLRARHVCSVNLALCFPQTSGAQRARTTRAVFVATARLAIEALIAWQSPLTARAWIRSVAGRDVLEDALARKRGVICLVPHFGNWEVLDAYLGHNYDFAALYAPSKNRWLERLQAKGRARAGTSIQPIGTGGIRTLAKTLARGGVIGLLPDQVPDGGAIDGTFFGRPVRSTVLAARLAQTHGAPLLLATARRRTDGEGFDVEFTQVAAETAGEDIATLCARSNAAIEALVSSDIEQYQWTYKRFKHAVPGHDPYRASVAR